MTDPRKAVLKALVAAMATATGKTVYAKIPKQDTVIYPYVLISDVYMEEDGQKNNYQYTFQILVEIVYKNTTSDDALYTDMAAITGIINNAVPFALDSPYQVMDLRLNNTAKTEVLTDSGMVDVGTVRMILRVE